MKKEYKWYMGIGAAILLIAIALQIFWSDIDPTIGRILIIAGITFIVLGVIRHLIYKEGPKTDERTKKISSLALSYSWIITLVLVGVLFLLDHWNILRMGVTSILGLTMFVMIVVAIVAKWYLNRRGSI